MTSASQLVKAKQNLATTLGPTEWKSYLSLMKQWFKRIISKETFDLEARKMCADRRAIQAHNELLLALFSTCQSLATTSSTPPNTVQLPPSAAVAAAIIKPDPATESAKAKTSSSPIAKVKAPGAHSTPPVSAAATSTTTSTNPPAPNQSPAHPSSSSKAKEKGHKKGTKVKRPKTTKVSFHNNFTPTNPLAYVPQVVDKPPAENAGLSFASREKTLPDTSLIHGRMLVAAWDVGLDGVDDAAIRFLQTALEHHVRGILMNMIKDRKSFNLRDGRFPSQFHYPSSFHDTEMSEEEESATSDGETDTIQCLASGGNGTKRRWRPPLGLMHLRDTLMRNKNIVASHTVYAINMERVFNAMEHPTRDETEYERDRWMDKEMKLEHHTRQLVLRLW